MTESDGETTTLFPKAARLRNLTYSSPLYVDVTKRVIRKGHDCEEVTEAQEFTKVFIGKVENARLTHYYVLTVFYILYLHSRFQSCFGQVTVACFRNQRKI